MFDAFSRKLNKPINISEVTDLNDTFCCLNQNCDAEYYVRGLNSERAAHFVRKRSTPHVLGCIYGFSSNTYADVENIIKSDLIDIYNGSKNIKSSTFKIATNSNSNLNGNQQIKYIKTPKELLSFCINNSLGTKYNDKLAVNDIVIDSRNILNNANFEGVNGLHLVIGNTLRYDSQKNVIVIRTASITKNKRNIFLTSTVHLSDKQLKEINNYLFDTFSSFANHPIAVLGQWQISRKYNIECEVTRPQNIIYKFANK